MEKEIAVNEKQEYFVPDGNGARAVSEAEYRKYSTALLEALDLIRTIKYAGQEDDVVGLSFLHDFRFRDYEGKNFLVNYLGDGEGVRYRIMKEFYYDTYFEAKRKFDMLVRLGRNGVWGSTY